jgi:hypothetical protein
VRRLAALAFVAIVVAGCGSSSGGSGTTTTAAAGNAANAGDRRAQIAACLKKQGVTLPNRPGGAPPQGGGAPQGGAGGGFLFGGGGARPNGGQGFRNNPKFQAAAKKCGLNFNRAGGAGRFNPSNNAQFRQSIDKFVACVRKNGYDLPSPNFSGNGPVFDASKVNRNDPKFQKAAQACQSLLNFGRRGTTGQTRQVQQQ